ncbi:UDP-glucose dehydrogenase [Klebsiella pneumoniae]|nr:UDP-glucose dehydrogenase [Klebsiella pneumoniae]
MSFSTISVIGLGYIGLPTAAAFASRQKRVVGVDVNQHAVETINRGEIHIVEPDLASVVKTAVEQGYLSATTTPVEADAYLMPCRRRLKIATSRIWCLSSRPPNPLRRR